MLHSILKAIVHKIYRQMMEQGHPTETGLLIFFPPLLGTTQAIYGTFIPSQIFNASTIYSLLENKACPPIDTRSVRECRFNNITCLWTFFYYFWYSVFSSSNVYTHSALCSNPYECQPDKLQTALVRRSYIAACQPDFLFSIRIFIIAFHNHAPLHFESYCPQNLQADDRARTSNRNQTADLLSSIIQSNTSHLWNIHTLSNP